MANRPLINTFSYHYRQKYGRVVGKIPLDTGVACPNRALGGCIFCHPGSFTPSYLKTGGSIGDQLRQGKKYLLKSRFRLFFGYFQQETTTALPVAELKPILETALADVDCVGIILSARPDCLDQELLEELVRITRQWGKECILEIGLQSSHERSLRLLNRNHGVADFVDAVHRIRALQGLQAGVHLILGIPGESEEDMRTTLGFVSSHGVDAVKLHHLQVIRGTPLHEMYCREEIPVFTAEEYLALLTRLLPGIPDHIVLHRLWSHAPPDILVAPRWDMLAGNLSARLQKMMEKKNLFQGKYTPHNVSDFQQ